MGVAVGVSDPDWASGVGGNARRHALGQVLVVAVGGDDAAAVLAAGYPGVPNRLPDSWLRVVVGCWGVADEGQRQGPDYGNRYGYERDRAWRRPRAYDG